MRYLLDTNICVYWLRNKYGISNKLKEVGLDNCAISEITMAELKYGEEVARRKGYLYKPQLLDELFLRIAVIPISEAIDFYAEEKARLRLAGLPNGDDFDLLIASTAVCNDMTLVTENVKDFKNVEGLDIANWVDRKM